MKFFFKTLSVFAITGFMYACDKSNVTSEPINAKPDETENLSAIEQIEKEAKVVLFKKDLKIKDESGLNEIVVRVAATNQKALDAYVEDFSFSIKAIEKGEVRNTVSKKANTTTEESSKGSSFDANAIYTEIISQKLASNVMGVFTNVKFVGKTDKKGRPYYNYTAVHVSPAWYEYLVFSALFDTI